MAIIKCKMCGGDLNLIEDQSVAECEYCGTAQTVPAADNEKKMSLFNRAHRLRGLCEFDKAAAVYEQIVAEFPEEAESYWGLVLCDYGIEYVDDPAEGKKIPTCHRSSYTSVLENRDFSMATEYADAAARKLYRQEAKQIEQLRQDIIAVSGMEEPYDIFICYKETDEAGNRTVDSVLAQDIYDALIEKGYRVFFSRISLEDKLGSAYEPYIFAALNSAKIMLVVGTDYDRFHAVWVKNEWSRFMKLMELDRNKYLIPCYRDIDAYDMPSEFNKLQAQDLGKVGAIQDLLRGIEKLMPKKKPVTVVREEVFLSENPNTAPLLRRAKLFLEDRDWESADKYCEKVLDMEPENGDAYFGKLMAEYHISREEELERIDPSCLNSANYQKTLRFGDDALQEKLEGIRKDTVYHAAKKLAARKDGREKANLREAITQLQTIPGWRDSSQQIEIYRITIREMEAREEAERQEQLRKEQQERQQRAERRRQAEEKRKQERKKAAEFGHKLKIVLPVVGIVLILTILANTVLVPMLTDKPEETDAVTVQAEVVAEETTKPASPEELAYAEAEKLLSDGETAKAAIAFGKLGDYSDARERSFALWREVAPPQVVSTSGTSTAAVRKDGTVLLAGYGDYRQMQCQEWTNIVSVSTCNGHTAGLKKDGTVVAVGDNQYKQCETTSWSDIIAIDTYGLYYTFGLKSDGTVVYTGSRGSLDEGSTEIQELSSWEDIAVIKNLDNTIVGIKTDGTVVTANIINGIKENGYAYGVDGELFEDWSDIISIAKLWSYDSQLYRYIGLKSDGTLVEKDIKTVKNEDGIWTQVVISEKTQSDIAHWTDIVAIDSGAGFNIGIKADSTVVSTGLIRQRPFDLSDWSDIVAISAHGAAVIGVKNDGSAVFAGDLDDIAKIDNWSQLMKDWNNLALPGQLRMTLPKTEDTQFPTLDQSETYAEAEKLLSSGETAKAAIAFGKLGDYKDARERSFALWGEVTVRDTISVSDANTSAIRKDGSVVSAGEVFGHWHNSNKWNVTAISANGGVNILGLKPDGTVVVEGWNDQKQAEVTDWSDIVAISSGRNHSVGLKSDGTVVATGRKEAIGGTEFWEDIVAIDAGAMCTMGLKMDGTVVFTDGITDNVMAVGIADKWSDIMAVSTSGIHTVGVKTDGTVVTLGFNNAGQTDVDGWTDIIAVDTGEYHTVGLKTDGTVVAVGDNSYGQCNVNEWTDIVAVSASRATTVGLKSDGTLVAAGNNNYGKLDVQDWNGLMLPRRSVTSERPAYLGAM